MNCLAVNGLLAVIAVDGRPGRADDVAKRNGGNRVAAYLHLEGENIDDAICGDVLLGDRHRSFHIGLSVEQARRVEQLYPCAVPTDENHDSIVESIGGDDLGHCDQHLLRDIRALALAGVLNRMI